MGIKKCKKCGSQDFFIQEIIFHEAFLCPEEDLTVFKDNNGGIQRIFCKDCDTDYSEDEFTKINFR